MSTRTGFRRSCTARHERHYRRPPPLGRRLALPRKHDRYNRCKKLSNSMLQEVNGLVTSVDDDHHHHGEGDLLGGAEENLPALQKVLEMAMEGHDLEMRKDFARSHRYWYSVKLRYVSARVENAVAKIDRRSQATLASDTEMRTETLEGF